MKAGDGSDQGEPSGSRTTGTAWMSVQSAADELELTPRTIYRLINDGRLAAFRFGRVYRIRRSDLSEFLERAMVRPGDLDHLVEPNRSSGTRSARGNGDRPSGRAGSPGSKGA